MSNLNRQIFQLYKQSLSLIDEKIQSRKPNGFFKIDTVPMFYKAFKKPAADVLFVGINPSLTLSMVTDFERLHGNSDLLRFGQVNKENFNEVIKVLIEFQEVLKGRKQIEGIKRIPYFSAIQNILEEIGDDRKISWEHYDLFSYRNTSQYSMTRLLSKSNLRRHPELKDYFDKSMQRLKEVVEYGNFKMVIIANAKVSSWIREYKILPSTKLKKCEIIFSKQLIGGLKRHERDDLIRSVKKLLKF